MLTPRSSVEANFLPAKVAVFYQGLLRLAPNMTALLGIIPNKQNDRLKSFFKTSLKVVRKILIEREKAIEMGEAADKDALGVLCTCFREQTMS